MKSEPNQFALVTRSGLASGRGREGLACTSSMDSLSTGTIPWALQQIVEIAGSTPGQTPDQTPGHTPGQMLGQTPGQRRALARGAAEARPLVLELWGKGRTLCAVARCPRLAIWRRRPRGMAGRTPCRLQWAAHPRQSSVILPGSPGGALYPSAQVPVWKRGIQQK